MPRTLYAEFTVTPGNEARVAEMMRELTAPSAPSRATSSSIPTPNKLGPTAISCWEAYADDAAFEAHTDENVKASVQESFPARVTPNEKSRRLGTVEPAARRVPL